MTLSGQDSALRSLSSLGVISGGFQALRHAELSFWRTGLEEGLGDPGSRPLPRASFTHRVTFSPFWRSALSAGVGESGAGAICCRGEFTKQMNSQVPGRQLGAAPLCRGLGGCLALGSAGQGAPCPRVLSRSISELRWGPWGWGVLLATSLGLKPAAVSGMVSTGCGRSRG